MKKNKNFKIIFIILLIVVLIFLAYITYSKFLKEKDNNTFNSLTESGKAIVLGYVTYEKLFESDCYSDTCKKYDYVVFNILETESEEFLEYIKSLDENYFASKKAIGIGCYNNNILSYYNHSDEMSLKYFSLTETESKKIMNSSKENPIKLELEKLKLTYGTSAPNCYSHITNIKIID